MKLFRPRPGQYQRDIAAFWAWWPTVAAPLAEALSGEDETLPPKLRRAVASRVAALHPELTWEFVDGALARHALVLSCEGAPELRSLTERWRRAGPGDGEEWEFHASRPPNPRALHGEVSVGGRSVRPAEARFSTEIDSVRARVHVEVYHPELPSLGEGERLWFVFNILDWVLGEDEVEQWVGDVRFSPTPGALDPRALRSALRGAARELGWGRWISLEGLDALDQPLGVEVRAPSPRLRYPLFDLYGTLVFTLARTPPRPLDEIAALALAPPEPDAAELAEIERATEKLLALLGDAAVLVAVATSPSRRVLHLYADSDGVVPEQVASWAIEYGFGVVDGLEPPVVSWQMDPAWEGVRAFL